jgi:hypothetical protein
METLMRVSAELAVASLLLDNDDADAYVTILHNGLPFLSVHEEADSAMVVTYENQRTQRYRFDNLEDSDLLELLARRDEYIAKSDVRIDWVAEGNAFLKPVYWVYEHLDWMTYMFGPDPILSMQEEGDGLAIAWSMDGIEELRKHGIYDYEIP